MTHTLATDALFFNRSEFERSDVERMVAHALDGADDGELFLELRHSESLGMEDGRLTQASFDTTQGYGLRAVAGEAIGFAHASQLSVDSLKRAAETVRAVRLGASGTLAAPPALTNHTLYTDENPLNLTPFADKVALLQNIDAYARGQDPRVKQVVASIAGSWQAVRLVRADGQGGSDIRPLVRLNVSVVVEGPGSRRETGSYSLGGRVLYDGFFCESSWKTAVDEALRTALINLEAVSAPAGEMDVVLGPGWPGVILHEAVGHGLEGDGNRKGTSAFASLMGERVAAPGVTIVDDGTLPDLRGSITIDDEGTPSQRTVLIEDGILKGYLQDRLNARLMGGQSTGNGRRESHACQPLVRMTNTFMMAGERDPAEIIASVKRGLYAVNFNGGQVDMASGKFVFSASDAFMIKDGKLTRPVKGATLIGNGPEVLRRVSMIGNDLELDRGVGTCGKDGQSAPVGVGQPTIRVDNLIVGGTS